MSYEYDGLEIGRNAGEDLSAARHTFVKIESGTGDVIQCDTAGEDALGVLQDEPDVDEDASVQVDGAPKVVATEAITRDDDIATDGSGKARTAQGGDQILGKALENAGADGEILPVLLDRNGSA